MGPTTLLVSVSFSHVSYHLCSHTIDPGWEGWESKHYQELPLKQGRVPTSSCSVSFPCHVPTWDKKALGEA